jgi:hypothetical protein
MIINIITDRAALLFDATESGKCRRRIACASVSINTLQRLSAAATPRHNRGQAHVMPAEITLLQIWRIGYDHWATLDRGLPAWSQKGGSCELQRPRHWPLLCGRFSARSCYLACRLSPGGKTASGVHIQLWRWCKASRRLPMLQLVTESQPLLSDCLRFQQLFC